MGRAGRERVRERSPRDRGRSRASCALLADYRGPHEGHPPRRHRSSSLPTAPPAPTSPRAIGPGSRAPRSRSRSTASCATSARRCPTARRSRSSRARRGRGALADPPRHGARAGRPRSRAFPGVKVTIGPPIENGFYYDFEFPERVSVSEADLERIEEEMREHIKADEPFERSDVTGGRGARALPARGAGLQGRADRGPGPRPGRRDGHALPQRPFTDLCRGPHAPAHEAHQGVQADQLAGAYWRGDADRQLLTRIYGTAFLSRRSSTSTCTASRRRAPRPPQARQGARPVPVLRAVARARRSGSPTAAIWNELTELWRERERGAATARCRRRSSTTSSCGSRRATGTSTATTCTSPRSRSGPSASSP